MIVEITPSERAMLMHIRMQVDELAKRVQEANAQGFNITFNINTQLGCAERFDVHRMVPVDLRSGAN